MSQTLYDRTLQRALKLLSYKPRSVAQLRARLLEKEWADEAVVDRVIARIEELGYLDDESFALHYATSRLATKPLGRSRLRRDLQRRQIPPQIAEQALNEVYAEESEEELIERAIAKRLRRTGVPTTRQQAQKLFDHLMRLGFAYELVQRKVRQLSRELEEEA
jgi:regulatory protein